MGRGSVAGMATLVTFHAHPDDECIRTAGVMRKAVEDGHRVVLVVATRGEVGEVPEGFLEPGEDLVTEDFTSNGDPMIAEDVPAGEAEGVLEEDEA